MDNPVFSSSVDSPDDSYSVVTLRYTPSDPGSVGLSVSVAPELGSNMFSMKYGKHELIYSDPAVLKAAGFTGTYVLFPTPNRVRDFTYSWNNKQYVLQKNGKPVDIHHQLVYDQPWNCGKPEIHPDHVSVSTSVTIDKRSHLYPGFPFPCMLTLEYRLYADSVTVTYTVANTGDTPVPFGFGLHPHFARLSGNDKTLITIPAEVFMQNYPGTMLPDGVLTDVTGTPQDVRTPTPAGNLSLDHVYTDIIPGRYASVDYTTLGFQVLLEASKDLTHIVVYTGNPGAVCIENQTCSTDAHNLYARGYKKESHLQTVPPHDTRSGSIVYKIQQH